MINEWLKLGYSQEETEELSELANLSSRSSPDDPKTEEVLDWIEQRINHMEHQIKVLSNNNWRKLHGYPMRRWRNMAKIYRGEQ